MVNKKQLLAVVCTVHFLLGLDINIIGVSLPTIASHFNVTGSDASRIVWIYFLVLTASLLGFGKLGDIIGFKKIYISGISLFTVATILIGFSPNINVLIAFRVLQAIGASVLFALTPAIISTYFPDDFKGKAFGINYIFTALGGVLGRSMSGFLLQSFGWYSVFAIKIPFGIIALILGLKYLPNIVRNNNKKIFDTFGAFLIFISLFAILFSVNSGNDFGWGSPLILSSLIGGFIVFAGFILYELRIHNPLFNLRLLRNKNLSVYLFSFLIIYIITNGMIFILPFYLQMFKGFSKEESGLLMAIPSIMQIIFGYISGYLSDKIDHKKIIISGMVFTLISSVLFTFVGIGKSFFDLVIILAVYGASIGFMIPSNTNTIMKHAPEEDKGSVSSFMTTTVRIGSALGVCFFAMFFSIYVPEKNPLTANVPASNLISGFKLTFYLVAVLAAILPLFIIAIRNKKDKLQ